MREHDLYTQIAQYLQLRYPSIIYRFDLAADLKLSIGQARKHKALHPTRGYPDLFIAEPRDIVVGQKPVMVTGGICSQDITERRCGLFIELKRPGTRIYKKDGTLTANEHIREQYALLAKLRHKGYAAEFACGFDEAKEIIDGYLGGSNGASGKSNYQ